MNPRWPIYILSKGRWESRMTSKALERIGVPYSIVVEPQEAERYKAVIDPAKVLVLPFSDQGSIPTRNWIWDHARQSGAEWHWCVDDNIAWFARFNRNARIPVGSGTIFRAAEDFVNRYENVGQAGFQYWMFAVRRVGNMPPFYLNTRCYSCILLRNDIDYQWRGTFNEDTDLSLQLLSDGWCTILFNAFLCHKQATMSMKGGNTERYLGLAKLAAADGYEGDGRTHMARELAERWPDIVKVTTKWGHDQHQVDYSGFANNRLIRKPGVEIPDGDPYPMVVEQRFGDVWRRADGSGSTARVPDLMTADAARAIAEMEASPDLPTAADAQEGLF